LNAMMMVEEERKREKSCDGRGLHASF